MKNKKGFSLTELLAVIAILAIIFSLATAGIKQIHANIVGKQEKNVEKYIEIGAEKYAKEKNYSNGIYYVVVQTLIGEGYIKADDDNGKIYNPNTKESLNCNIIKIECGQTNCTAEIDKGNPSTEEDENGNQICKEIETERYEICYIDGDICKTIDNETWFSNDLTLGVKKIGTAEIIDDDSITWSNKDGGIATAKYYEVNLNGKDYYNSAITAVVNSIQTTKQIKIDKEKPVVSANQSNDWTNKEIKLNIKYSDNKGSGINGMKITTDDSDCNNINNYIKASKTKSYNIENTNIDKIYICVKDRIGNISDPYEINNLLIDKSNPVIEKQVSTGNILITDDKSGLAGYKITNSEEVPTSWENITGSSYEINQLTETGTYYIHAIDKAGNTSYLKEVVETPDNEGPVYVSGGSVSCGNISEAIFEDASEPITVYYYYSSSASTPASSSFTATTGSGFTCPSCSCTSSKTRYGFAKAVDAKGNETIKKLGSYTKSKCSSTNSKCSSSGDDSGGGSSGGTEYYDTQQKCMSSNSCGSGWNGSCNKLTRDDISGCKKDKYLCNCCKSPKTYSAGQCKSG